MDAYRLVDFSYLTGFLAFSSIYLLIIRCLRFQRLNKLEKRYSEYVEKPYAMSYRTAHEIAKLHMFDEQLYMHAFSTQWALIKTYGIARGTKLLVDTKQIGTLECVGRRTEDTGIFLSELLVGDMDDARWMTALSKVNWLHSRYKSRISNREMLYTLGVFILEPITFINAYGWRPLTKMEEVSRFLVWKEIGLRMGIEDIPETLEDYWTWIKAFEDKECVFSPNNVICAENTLDLFLRDTPRPLRSFMRQVAQSILEPKYRRALGWPNPPPHIEWLVATGFRCRAWMLRNLAPPRFYGFPHLPEVRADGRIYRSQYLLEPWYMSRSWWTRVKVWASSGGRLHSGGKWGNNGYRPEEVGPPAFIKASKEPVLAQAEAMSKYADERALGRCPFTNGGELKWTK